MTSGTCLIQNGWTRGLLAMFAGAQRHGSTRLVHFLMSFGLVGLFLVSIVDSSFIPLPIPGITDVMVLVLAAQHSNIVLLVGVATLGSALGGLFSHKVGQAGGMAFIEKHISPRIFHLVCDWMERHAILSVALPAILPPPMPLSPFVLAAGALQMSRRKFMISFTVSRFLRHCAAAALGVYFGRSVLHLWNMFSRKWAVPILVGVWCVILVSVGIGLWRLYKTSRDMGRPGDSQKTAAPAQASSR
jgi:membrane protein YqaA with SNARE-associated domain